MKKTKTFKRLSIMLLAIVMVLALVPTAALAANETIDTTKTGSITLYKYDGDALSTDQDLSQAEMKALIDADQALAAPTLKPEADVTFRYIRVGDVKQYTKNPGTANETVKIGYSLTGTTITPAFLGLTAADIDYTDTTVTPNVNYYTPSTLDAALKAKTQAQLEAVMTAGTAMPATSAAGKTEATNLTLGAYLISEQTYPSGTTATTEPFFISVPMTDTVNATTGATEWIYDVTAYPKNKVEPTNIDKVIVGNDGNETKELDAEIGETVTFLVRSDVPNQIGKMTTYKITDTLSAGMDYTANSIKVNGIAANGARTAITAGFTADYTGKVLTVNFTPANLADTTSKQALYKYLEITYDVTLNKDSVVGGAGNPNNIKLDYSKFANYVVTPGVDEPIITAIPVEMPKVYTYAIDYLKYGDSDTANPLAGVEFELYRYDATAKTDTLMKVAQVTAGTDGAYYVLPDASTATSATIKTPTSGKINIKGLEAGTYHLKETKTVQGYNLLAEMVEITITSNENEYTEAAAGTYAPIAAGTNYFTDAAATKAFAIPAGLAAGTYVNFGTKDVYTAPGVKVAKMYTQDALDWSANYTMGDKAAAAGSTGVVSFKVNNVKGFNLPQTGGNGIFYFIAIGGAIAVIGLIVVLMALKKKKKTAHSN